MALAQEIENPFSLNMALWGRTLLHQLRRVAQLVLEQADAVIQLATQQGLAFGLSLDSHSRGEHSLSSST